MFKKIMLGIVVLFALVGVGSAFGGGGSSSSDDSNTSSSFTSTDDNSSASSSDEPVADDGPNLTSGQENAMRTGTEYVDMSGISRKGLIKQLKFEGYSQQDATYAANHLGVDWNKEAAQSAKEYVEMSGFSRSGLITQLKFEGYTPAQAAYGASKAL